MVLVIRKRPLVQKAISTHAGVIPHYNDTYVIRMWFMLIMYYPYGLFRYIQNHHYTSKFFFLTEKSVRVLHADNMIFLKIYLQTTIFLACSTMITISHFLDFCTYQHNAMSMYEAVCIQFYLITKVGWPLYLEFNSIMELLYHDFYAITFYFIALIA